MSLGRKLASLYGRIGRTYLSRAPSLLLLATVIFVPVGLPTALTAEVNVDTITLSSLLEIAAAVGAVAAIAMTGLLGEVFYSGVVAVSLTNPEGTEPPSISEIARRLDYRNLILVDLAYVLIVIVGLALFVLPGLLLFVWFGLSGPVVEIERRSVRGALARSWHLVRGNFWMVLLVLGPVELLGDVVAELVAGAVHSLFGDALLATWLAESLSNIAFTPIFAVAAVLLTLDLIAARDGESRLDPAPQAAPA